MTVHTYENTKRFAHNSSVLCYRVRKLFCEDSQKKSGDERTATTGQSRYINNPVLLQLSGTQISPEITATRFG
jgi:hypothetical protein